MRQHINPILCQGHAKCIRTAPELWRVDEYGYAWPLFDEVPPELEATARQAAHACPTLAIMLEEAERDGHTGAYFAMDEKESGFAL